MDSPNWLIVLRHWQRIKNRTTLTFPYLIGTERLAGNHDFAGDGRCALQELVNRIRNIDLDHSGYFSVYRCDGLEKWVISEIVNATIPSQATRILSTDSEKKCRLAVTCNFSKPDHPADAFQMLVDAIWKESAEAIADERYDCDDGKFTKFDHSVVSSIKEALQGGLIATRPQADFSKWEGRH
jgi:hypothetical protein